MKEKYIFCKLEIILFDTEDVITDSADSGENEDEYTNSEYELPFFPVEP